MIQYFFRKQFLIFLLVGGIATIANLGSRVVYNYWLSFSSAIILSYITGMITTFILAKLFVFRESQQSIYYSVLFFILVNLVGILQMWGVSMGLAYYVLPALGINTFIWEISHVVGVAVPVFTSYIGYKHLSFRQCSQ